MVLLRKIILATQYGLAITALIMGIMLWMGSMDFKNIAHFLALLSLLTGTIIFTSCTSPEINSLKKFFLVLGFAGWFAGMGSALVFWQKLPVDAWYFMNLILVLGICFSLFAETEKGSAKKERSVIHVVAGIIILLTFFFLSLHVLGMINMRLPLLILIGAVAVLMVMVVVRNGKREKESL
jgi:hypothetical protein